MVIVLNQLLLLGLSQLTVGCLLKKINQPGISKYHQMLRSNQATVRSVDYSGGFQVQG